MGPDLWEMFEDGKADDEVAAIIRLGHHSALPRGVRLVTQFSEIITVRMTRADVLKVSGAPEVVNMVAGDTYLGPDVEAETMESVDLSVRATDERRPKEEKATGAGVVVGVVDWGFDFAHPDFRKKDGTTRILALWDQRGSRRPGSPQPFGYGIVHDREAINQALKTADPYAALGYHPADADTGIGCHGTHVLSIAAGSGAEDRPSGIAPEADLVVVHNAPWDEAEPSRLGDSVTVLEGIDFIARTAGERPWVINLSMGRHSGFHNGQELVEQGFDAAVRSAPGRAISLSAGNYFGKNIHASGQLRPTQTRTLTWEIKEGEPTNNQIEFWYSWQDKMELAVRSPDGSLEARVKLGERAKLVSGGKEVGNVYHRGQDPISLNNLVSVFLYPEAPPGDWQLTLYGTDIIDGRYHAWIERDVSCPRCQSHFRAEDADPRSTTGTICNGRRTFAVGAYNSHSTEPRIASFSSCGPTLDGRLKPDLCAPGIAVLAARSARRDKNDPAPLLTRMSGTSMASPSVCGTIALMFQAASRRLRIEETHNLLLEAAERISIPDEIPDRIGIGFLDVSAAVEAARKIDRSGSTFKETTVRANPTTERSIAVTKSENREGLEGIELEGAMETSETASAGCACQHAHVAVEERPDANTDFFEELYFAEDEPKGLDIAAPPKEVADALAAKDWAGALSAAIRAGVRDQNVLTDLVFFARHHELPVGVLDPKGPKFKVLSSEWGKILNSEVWKAIQTASENTSLVVSGTDVADNDRFFWGVSGRRLKKLVEQSAKDADLNPGLLGTILMAETRDPATYLSSEKVSSYYIGTDDFYEGRAQIAARVPAYKKVKWDQSQTPVTHSNDAQKRPREVKSILFDSGPDAILATAVYAKFREVRLREVAKTLNGDFDKLPFEVRLALTRIAMAAGTEGAKPFLNDALAGRDIFVRKDIPTAIYQTQRNATVRTAQALHLSEWIFGISLAGSSHAEAVEVDDREATEEDLRKKLAFLSFLPHFVRSNGNDVALTPAGMDPGIYDGPEKYKIAEKLQKCLNTAVNNSKFGHIRVALVDLTKDVSKPEFAGFNHKDQVFAASLPKVAAMLAAFQLRHDLEAALTNKGSSAQEDLFSSVRDDWAATQADPKGPATPFSDGITVRGKLVLWKDNKIELGAIPKSPKLEAIFPKADFPSLKFSSTGETKPQLRVLIKEFEAAVDEVGSLRHQADSTDEKVKADAAKKLVPAKARLNKATHDLQALGFEERLRVAMGGMVPASNLVISTIVRGVGFPYIASTLLQSGLYDPSREGGIWLGASYWDSTWRNALKGGNRQSTTAGSAAAFMTLLAQGRLVDASSSAEMRALLQKTPDAAQPTIVSWFEEGLGQLRDGGSIVIALSKLGVHEGIDDCAFIERKVDGGTKTIRYVAVGLRARTVAETKALILELDKCILANNGLAATLGGHSAELVDEESSFVQAGANDSARENVPVELLELADDVAAGTEEYQESVSEAETLETQACSCGSVPPAVSTQADQKEEVSVEMDETEEMAETWESEAIPLASESTPIATAPPNPLEIADEFVLEKSRSTTAVSVVAEMLERQGATEALIVPGENRSLSAAEVFDALTSRRQTQLRQHLEQHFEVVALPNALLSQDVRAADLMIRRGYGDTGHMAIIARPQLKNVQELLAEGVTPESIGSGNYAQVIEGGVKAHSNSDQFARQLTDSFGRVMNDILLVRLATQPTVVQVPQQPAKSGDDPDLESVSREDCSEDISEFGRTWRLAHDAKRNPRPQLQNGRLLCAGKSDLKRHGANNATLDLLLFNFDIDGSYTKTQHEAALDRLISVIHDNITANATAGTNEVAYEISLQGYADRTGSARYNELLATDRERAVEAYCNENIDRFRKPSEGSIRERIRYARMQGGFAPDALPGKNTPHARAVLAWAVPIGGEKPEPRPAPSTRLDPNYWFLPAEEIGRRTPAFTEGNEVVALVDGSKYMADLLASLQTCDRNLYVAGWRFTGQQYLNPADPSPIPTIDAVRNSIPRGAHIRAMIYKVLGSGAPGPFRVWHAEDNRIFCEALRTARQEAILDARLSPRALSAHHQKFVVVESSKPEKTVAYVGGIDLCLDRWDSPAHSSTCPKPDPIRQCDIIEFYASLTPAPAWVPAMLPFKGLISTHFPSQPGWHDVQARVRGPALQQIWEVFRDRWNDPRPANKDSATANCQIAAPIGGQAPAIPQVSLGTSWVQVTQTLPCRGVFGPYPFAPNGEQTIEKAYIRAIDRAESYIYVEDQYLWPSLLVDRLVAALKRNVHVVILVARDFDLVGLTAVHARMRGQVIQQLRTANPSHFKVFHLQQPAGGQIYVHAKTMIIDDMVAFIGSANLNHRSMTNDTELQLGILDSSSLSVPINGNATQVSKFAHDYRCELWQEHLGVGRTQILDPIVAINTVWASAPGPNRRVFPHQVAGNLDLALLAEVIADLIVEFGIPPIPELPLLVRSLPKKAIQEAIELALRGSSALLGKVIDWLAGILNPRLACQPVNPLWKGSVELHHVQLARNANAYVESQSA